MVKQLGDGTYGSVWKAINRQTNEVVSSSCRLHGMWELHAAQQTHCTCVHDSMTAPCVCARTRTVPACGLGRLQCVLIIKQPEPGQLNAVMMASQTTNHLSQH